MPSTEETIKREWITSGGGELWNTEGTYSTVAYERLPPLPLPGRELLSKLPTREYECTLHSDDNRIAGFAPLEAALRSLGLVFPEEFARFMTDPELQKCVPSCTACYLELSDAVTPLPGFLDHYVVRFMNDSQACVLWYLLFQPSLPTRVLATSCFIERDIFDAMEYEQDVDKPLAYEAVLNDARICAESFDEFIGRFCIENTIWFATHESWPLALEELRYLRATNGNP